MKKKVGSRQKRRRFKTNEKVQDEKEEGWMYSPAAQYWHTDTPNAEYDPVAHGTHTWLDVAPWVDEYNPGMQAWQVSELAAAMAEEKEPAAQAWQAFCVVAWVCVEYNPAPQLRQFWLLTKPKAVPQVPAAHAVHALMAVKAL